MYRIQLCASVVFFLSTKPIYFNTQPTWVVRISYPKIKCTDNTKNVPNIAIHIYSDPDILKRRVNMTRTEASDEQCGSFTTSVHESFAVIPGSFR